MGVRSACVALLLACSAPLRSQVSSFPYVERFDSVQTPGLPSGWLTSANRLAGGDFFTTTTSPRSAPFAVQSSNSTVPQTLITPLLDLSGRVPSEFRFFIARSGTHTSGVLVEASLDGGSTWPIVLSDTLRNPGTTGYVETVLSLPSGLSDKDSCRIRWRILGGQGGTSGTLRIDDVSVTVHVGHDAGLTALQIIPPEPTAADNITIVATVRSFGVLPSTGYAVDIVVDDALLHSESGPDLNPGDTLQFVASLPPFPPGEHRGHAILRYQGDEDASNDTIHVAWSVGLPRSSVVINEIQYAPSGDEPEWVEVLNISPWTADLRDWRISDSRTSVQSVITRSPLLIPTGSFAVIARDSGFFAVHSTSVPVVVTPFSALNNTTPDAVVITDVRGHTMDSIHYEPFWGGNGGRSLERLDAWADGNDPGNWLTSAATAGSTPGRANSVALAAIDLRLESAGVFGSIIAIQVRNAGREDVQTYAVRITNSATEEEIGELAAPGLIRRGEIHLLSYAWTGAPSGTSSLRIEVVVDGEMRHADNVGMVRFFRGYEPGSLVINEIMYEPLSGTSEWVEVYNTRSEPIDLERWTVLDAPTASGNRTATVLQAPIVVPSGGYAVIAGDSTFFDRFPGVDGERVVVVNQSGGLGFGNEGDAVVLKDPEGTMIDSVLYWPSWHHAAVPDARGRSLERIRPDLGSADPRAWSTSADPRGGSPAARNSIFTPARASPSSLSFSPNPFSPDGDGHEDLCSIQFQLPSPSSVIFVRIFDLQGRLIRTLVQGETAGPSGELFWDGMESPPRRARIGPHILHLEALGSDGSRVTLRGVIVVATRL